MTPDIDTPLPDELLDEETWAAPERLTADDCFDHLGGDWRRPSTAGDPEDGA